jgi:hypothetical protein
MNKCLSLVHLITACFMPFHMAMAQTELPQARTAAMTSPFKLSLNMRLGRPRAQRIKRDSRERRSGD